MTLTVTEAAEAAGVARSTLYRAIEAGEITRTPDKRIDVAELVRVYGELRHLPGEEGAAATTSGDTSPETTAATAAAGVSTRADEAAWLRSLVDRQQATIEQQARELREAEERAERREATWLKQLDALTTKLLPAPLQPEAPEPPRGVFRRLFG